MKFKSIKIIVIPIIVAVIFIVSTSFLYAKYTGQVLVHQEFPQIQDWNSLRIILDRGRCLGTCPDYRVEIHGDGTVLYEGFSFVATKGKRQGSLSQNDVHQLFEQFKKTDYFSLNESYRSEVTDQPTYTTFISFDKQRKSVKDYFGRQVGMPKSVTELEDAIDKYAGTEKWVKGTSTTNTLKKK